MIESILCILFLIFYCGSFGFMLNALISSHEDKKKEHKK